MEDINKTDITDQVLGNLSTHKSISKSKNIFKLLFFISIFILLIVIVSFCFIFFNKKSYQASNNNISQITPTIPVSKSDNSNISAYIKIDNKNNYMILNKNNEEIIIDTIDDQNAWFDEIRFTASLRYLTYTISAPGATLVKIYDTKNNSFIKDNEADGFFPQSSPLIITNDEKYLIFCSGSDYAGIGGGKIISLQNQTVKFDFIKYLGNKIADSSISCSYNSNTNIVSFEYYQGSGGTKDAGVNYNLNTDQFEDWQIDK